MTSPIVVIGEALIDIVERDGGASHEESPGGSPANVAVALGRLGADVRFITQFGRDERGLLLADWLDRAGVDVPVGPLDRLPTSTAVAVLGADGSAEYEFDLSWALPADAMGEVADAIVLHVGSIATVLEPGATVVRDAVRAHSGRALITFDPNARPAITPDRELALASVEEFVRMADIVKVSTEDIEWYYPDAQPDDAARRWATMTRRGRGMIALTRGAGGADLIHARGSFAVAAPSVTVVDTIAAGDTFTAGLIDAVVRSGINQVLVSEGSAAVREADLRHCVEWAVRAAAVTVSRYGADPPTREEMLRD